VSKEKQLCAHRHLPKMELRMADATGHAIKLKKSLIKFHPSSLSVTLYKYEPQLGEIITGGF
jgi:hypothetical protein